MADTVRRIRLAHGYTAQGLLRMPNPALYGGLAAAALAQEQHAIRVHVGAQVRAHVRRVVRSRKREGRQE